jgi:uncharacterized RDD family membrane protein YckC
MTGDAPQDGSQSNAWRQHPPLPAAAPELYAGVIWRRCLAYLVDVVLVSIVGVMLGFCLTILGFLSFGLLSPLAIIILALWPLAYHGFFVATRGATPGMRFFDIEFRDWSGKPVEPAQGLLVVLLFFVSIALTVWLVVLVVLFTERNRALHDILAGTVVVRHSA